MRYYPAMSNPHEIPSLPPQSAETSYSDLAGLAFTMREEGCNKLELPLPDPANNQIVPVASLMTTYGSVRRSVYRDGPTLRATETYPEITTRGIYLGLWPEGNRGNGAAALYKAEATFTPKPLVHTFPFRKTMRRLLGGLQPLIETPEEDILYGGHPYCTLTATANTILNVSHHGENQLHGTVHMKPHFSGEVVADISGLAIGRLTDTEYFTASNRHITLQLPEGTPQRMQGSAPGDVHSIEVPTGHTLKLDEQSGRVVRTAQPDHERYKERDKYTDYDNLNPQLLNGAETVINSGAELEWVTSFDRTTLSRVWESVHIDSQNVYESFVAQARTEIEARLQEKRAYDLDVIPAIAEYLTSVRDKDHRRTSDYHVTQYWYEKQNR